MFVHVQPNLPPLPTDVSTLFNQGHLTIIYEWPTPCCPLTLPALSYGTHHHPQIILEAVWKAVSITCFVGPVG